MLHKPKDPIQMKQQRENNQNKEKPKPINPLQDLYSLSSTSSKHLVSTKSKSLVKCTRNTSSTLKPRMGLTNNGSRKTNSMAKNVAFPKPKSKIGQRSNFSSDLASGCEESEAKLRCIKPEKVSVTPVNKSFCGSSLDCGVFEDSNVSSERNSVVKTPPLEASVSPEIQFGASGLMNSGVTPTVCYGTGHFLSGVTDRRKCRSRGILTVGDGLDYVLGSGKDGNEFDCDYSFGGKVNEKVKESGSLIPLPVEASVKWLLSPCDENCESPTGESSSKLMKLGDEGFCPSVCIGSDSDLVCDSSEHVLGILDTPSDSGKTCMVSPGRFSELKEDFLSNGLVDKDENGFCRSNIEGKSPLSIGSLSSGNMIQTPNSDYSSGKNRGGCWLNTSEHGTCTFKPELDNHLSSVSVSSVDNMSQSHMRISWRDLLASRSSDMDELDCCRCVSDEDIGVDEFSKLGDDCSSRRENGKSTGGAYKSPECIVHDINFPLREKVKGSSYKLTSCAESISTEGGGLAASEDFD